MKLVFLKRVVINLMKQLNIDDWITVLWHIIDFDVLNVHSEMSYIGNIKCLFVSSFVGYRSEFKILTFVLHFTAEICIHLTFGFVRTEQGKIIHNEDRNLKVWRIVVNCNELNIILFWRSKFMRISNVDLLWIFIGLDYKRKLSKTLSLKLLLLHNY